jgi:hypothetical protein
MVIQGGALYQMAPFESVVDNIERVECNAQDTLVHFFHLEEAYLFVPGSYRLRCMYRNDIKQAGTIVTRWVYFRVENTIPICHHYSH